jgi:hypothetical protein
MNENNRDRFINELLDASLAQYSRVEPRQGLEERLLAQVQSAKPVRLGKAHWSWYFVPATAAAAAVLAIGGLLLTNQPVPTPAPAAAAVAANSGSASAASAPSAPVNARDMPLTHPAPARVTKSLSGARPVIASARPRRAMFPSPEPLTEQDRNLLQWIQGHEPSIERLLNNLPAADQAPGKIQVAAMQVPALTIEPIAIPVLEPDK